MVRRLLYRQNRRRKCPCYINLHAGGCTQPAIDAGAYAEEDDTHRADSKRKARVAVALERRQWSLCLLDVHSLHDKQVVVE